MIADEIIKVLLNTSMFIGGVVAFILDNTVPGKNERFNCFNSLLESILSLDIRLD